MKNVSIDKIEVFVKVICTIIAMYVMFNLTMLNATDQQVYMTNALNGTIAMVIVVLFGCIADKSC